MRKKLPVRKKKLAPVKKGRKTEIHPGIPHSADTTIKVHKRVKGKKVAIPSKEMHVLIAETLERLGFYRGQGRDIDVSDSCVQLAEVIRREIVYGINDQGYTISTNPITPVVEHEYPKIPKCKEHK